MGIDHILKMISGPNILLVQIYFELSQFYSSKLRLGRQANGRL